MTPILVLEAFGELPSTGILDSERTRERRKLQDPPTGITVVGLLHRAFEARAELMAWSKLWELYEAGLVSNGADPSMIGWVYVGLANAADLSDLEPDPLEPGTAGWATFSMPAGYGENAVRLSVALPPLIQCLDDALRHIGAIEISGFQLTCYRAHFGERGRSTHHLNLGGDWFDLSDRVGADALITFDRGFPGVENSAEMMNQIQSRRTGAFSFGRVVSAPESYQVNLSADTLHPDVAFEPSNSGLSVKLPEWSPSAAGRALASMVEVVEDYTPIAENFVIRITQVINDN